MGAFSPAYGGVMDLTSVPDDFTERMARRVETGLLVPGSRRRADYVVRRQTPDAISFGADGLLTAYAFGLNEVELRREGSSRIKYQGSFVLWARLAVVQGMVVAAAILVLALAVPAARDQVVVTPGGWPALIAIAAFFGLAWPWLLIAFHRRVVAQSLERIVRQVAAA